MSGGEGFRSIVDPEVAVDYRSLGWWGDRTLSDVVRDWAQERPTAPAFIADTGTLDYATYDRAASRTASALIGAGFEPGDRLIVWLPDSAGLHVVFLAAERAGITVVGVGSRSGPQDLEYLLGRTDACGIVTGAIHRGEPTDPIVDRLRNVRSDHRLRHVVVPTYESDPDGPVRCDGSVVEAVALDESERIGPDDLFLINSTSGTTGRPKCVMHFQNRWFYFHQKAVENGQLTSDDIFVGSVPAPFGFGIWTSHFTPAILGAPTIVAERFDAGAVLEAIERERATVISCVSTQFIMMMNHDRFHFTDLSSLRVMFTGGEAIPFDKAMGFERDTGCTVLQFFGSNETGVLSATAIGDPPDARLRTAGRVVPEMRVRLYDNGVDVTESGRGQPACRGPAMCTGYLDDEDANGELFTPDGWMLMGDVCTLEDDHLTLVGRTSDIIIRGGKNVSASQVEEEVARHPAVAMAAAVPAPDEVFGERVCVFVELHDGETLTIEDLTAFFDDRGTTREIRPEFLIIVDELPRSVGGKVSKAALKEEVGLRLG